MTPVIKVDTLARKLTISDRGEVPLTEYEYRLVERLAMAGGEFVTKHDLVLAVWPEHAPFIAMTGAPDATMNNSVENLVWRVRAKIEPDPTRPRYLRSERRRGYRLFTSGDAPLGGMAYHQTSQLQDLWELAHPTESLYPVPATSARFLNSSMRDLGERPDMIQWRYRLHSELCLVLRPSRAGHLLLLDEGPSGSVYCLCPSQFAPHTLVGNETLTLPQPESMFASFRVSGSTGLEQLLVIISEEPLPLDWLSDDPSVPARRLSEADLDQLRRSLAALRSDAWGVWSSHFEVIP